MQYAYGPIQTVIATVQWNLWTAPEWPNQSRCSESMNLLRTIFLLFEVSDPILLEVPFQNRIVSMV